MILLPKEKVTYLLKITAKLTAQLGLVESRPRANVKRLDRVNEWENKKEAVREK